MCSNGLSRVPRREILGRDWRERVDGVYQLPGWDVFGDSRGERGGGVYQLHGWHLFRNDRRELVRRVRGVPRRGEFSGGVELFCGVRVPRVPGGAGWDTGVE